MRVRPLFAWYDLWIGLYWNRKARRLYVLPLPMLGVVVEFGEGAHGQSAHARAQQLDEMSARLLTVERDRDDYRDKYLATVAAWEQAKAARERSDALLQQCLDELRKSTPYPDPPPAPARRR